MGFRGFVISDAWAVASLAVHGYARDPEDAAYRGLTAGVNMDMGSETYLRHVAKLVESGKLPVSVLDQAVREILAIKIRIGLFEHPYGDLAEKEKVLERSGAPRGHAHGGAALHGSAAQREQGSALEEDARARSPSSGPSPIRRKRSRVRGRWRRARRSRYWKDLRNKLPNAKIEFVRGGDMQRLFPMPWDAGEGKKATPLMPEAEMRKEVEKAVEAAKRAETVVLVLGERAGMSGEAASRVSLSLPGNQQRLLEAVVATGKPVVLVLLNGRPLDIAWAAEHVPAILEAWYPGTEGGNAIADVLFGDVNPGGKLPVSWPRTTGQVPAYYNHNLTHAPEDDPGFTSRYADFVTAPLYPFGYGLSYTTFGFSNLQLDRKSMPVSGTLQVSVDVENQGAVAGRRGRAALYPPAGRQCIAPRARIEGLRARRARCRREEDDAVLARPGRAEILEPPSQGMGRRARGIRRLGRRRLEGLVTLGVSSHPIGATPFVSIRSLVMARRGCFW